MTHTQYFRLFMLLLFSVLSMNARGQSSLDSLEYSVGLKFSGSRSSGIFNRNSFAFGAEKHLHQGKWTFHNTLTYRYTEFNGIQLENNWYDLFSVFYYPNEKQNWYPVAFYHFDNNLLFRVNSRHRVGAAIGSVLLKKDHVFLRVGAGGGYEASRYNGDQFANSDLGNSFRENGLFLFRINNDYTFFDSRFVLKLDLFYMKSTKEILDFDIWFRPSLLYRITERITLSANYDYRYEHVHLEELPAANDILLYGLNIKFANP